MTVDNDESDRQADHDDRNRTNEILEYERIDYSSADRSEENHDAYADANRPTGQVDEERGQTSFMPSEAPPERREYLEWLRKLNANVRDSDRRAEIHRGGIKRDLGAATTQLGASNYHQKRAATIIEQVEIKPEISRTISIEAVVLGVLSLVMDADRSRYKPSDSLETPTSIMREDSFDELIQDFEVSRDDVRRVRKAVRELDAADI
jgi:hypothetical protein